ncbi:TetR/AcrR family transcriptional regulator [Clostridium saccharoperbutylacetonicum]
MDQGQEIHAPRQKRSELTRSKILDTALELFCQKGYYKTTTNEIATCANISIGNLYFYFPNKETIFFEILDRYHQSFLAIHETFLSEMENLNDNFRDFLMKLMEVIIKNHEESKALNKEIQILSFSNPKVAEILETQQTHVENAVLRYFQKSKDKIKVHDIEAATSITFSLINSIVDQIVFSKNKIARKRLLEETVNAVEAYLFGVD